MNNVLIIEDDKEICVMIKDHLEKYNYQVFFTLTGANAIERIKELSPDLIILYKVIVQLNAILNRKTKKLVTVSLSDRRLEHLVEIINQIVSKDTSGQGLYIVKKLLLMMNCTNPIIEIHDHNFMITIDFSPLLIKK